MADWLNIRVDGLSFLLGLVAGTLFWAILGQAKNYSPQIRATFKKKYQEFRDRNFSGVEVALRQEALKRAQHSHLAAQLFSLDEIIIQPKLIAPPPMIDPSLEQQMDGSPSTAFPFLPDWPELSSQYNIDFLSLSEALQSGANLVVIAPSGAGKTVALAHLATCMARKDPTLGVILDRIPIFLHVQEILSQHSLDEAGPVATITHVLTPRVPILEQGRVPSFMKSSFSSGRFLLLLDGLDELSPAEMKSAVNLIRLLLKENPQLRIVTTSSPTRPDGLLELGFLPVGLAAWNRAERNHFIENWGRIWNDCIVPEIRKKNNIETVDPVFIKNWVSPDQIHLTPFEWTLMLWTIYAGEGGEISPQGAVEAFVSRCLPGLALRQLMEKLALEMIKGQKSSLNEDDIEGLISRSSTSQVHLFDPAEFPQEASAAAGSPRSRLEPATIHSQSTSVLIGTGLMLAHPGRILRFSHPIIAAYLAASSCPELEISDWLAGRNFWETGLLMVGYFLAKYPGQIGLPNEWIQGSPPFFLLPLAASRWLKFMPTTHPMRARIMKRLVDGITDPGVMFAVRMRFTSALVCAKDPSLGVLFKQLLSSQRESIRMAACLAAGIAQDPKNLLQIASLLNDPYDDVRRNACFALGILRDKDAQEILVECLSADDEILRETSAISLAADPGNGYSILQESIKSENLLIRRSAVFGLVKINESWAKELLEQIAVQDGQWVVRNAASQALDLRQKPNAHIPRPLTPQSETPWLFNFASKLGQGIPPGDQAVDILLQALSTGSIEEKLAALDYLRLIPDEKVTLAISSAAVSAPHPVDDAAQLALWFVNGLRTEKAMNRTPVK
jgi:HEAT repeat protein